MNPAELFRQAADAFQLAPGDFLFREGDKRDKMYVLLEGEMDIRLGDYVFETAGAGALIGVIALIDDSPRPANAVAKTACRLVPVDQRRFVVAAFIFWRSSSKSPQLKPKFWNADKRTHFLRTQTNHHTRHSIATNVPVVLGNR
jgi:CRP/FNR family transcriptional regulator, cyclic AMP receptor protein